MKILIPSIGFARAGGYRVLSQLADYWIADGHQVDFLVHAESEDPYFPTSAEILYVSSAGSIAHEKRPVAKKLGFKAYRNLFSLFRGLSKVGANYDIILANQSLTAWPVALAECGHAKKFYYVQAYEPEYYALMPGFKAMVYKWLSVKSYSFRLVQICNAAIYLKYKEIEAIDWVPPGIDKNIFYAKSHRKNLATTSHIVLGCIGRHEPQKGISYVLAAFEALTKIDQRFRLRVAYGNLPSDYSHPLLEVVIPKNDHELSEYYRSLDIMLAPGTVQLGAVHYPVLEAMSCGVPIVTTGYSPATVDNAWIVPIKDAGAIAAAVLDIIKSPIDSVETKVELAERATDMFSWPIVANKFIEIFHRFEC